MNAFAMHFYSKEWFDRNHFLSLLQLLLPSFLLFSLLLFVIHYCCNCYIFSGTSKHFQAMGQKQHQKQAKEKVDNFQNFCVFKVHYVNVKKKKFLPCRKRYCDVVTYEKKKQHQKILVFPAQINQKIKWKMKERRKYAFFNRMQIVG